MATINTSLYPRKLYCLVMTMKPNQILLGYKKRGFGKDKWNGFGGKVEKGETPQEAAIRELHEESSLSVSKANMKQIGFLEFTFVGKPTLMEVHVFQTEKFSGEPQESDEMRPQWFNFEDVPYDQMWPDDVIWYEMMFKKQKFRGHCHFDDDKLLHHTICVTDSV